MHVTKLAPNIECGRGCETIKFVYVALCTVTSRLFGKYVLFIKYLTSTNMPNSQQKERAQIGLTEILVISSRLF